MSSFIGRERELVNLKRLFSRDRSSMVVIKGRRRIGKSRLATQFASLQAKRFFSFTGLAPDSATTAQQQLNHFASQLSLHLDIPKFSFLDWNEAFNALTLYITECPTVILLDEISWMGDKDPTFVGKLKTWWDQHISTKSNVMIIICGSISTWINENIINSTALFGRISLIITLEPLSLPESHEYLRSRGYKGSLYDIYKILMITGGVPWYLEQISPLYMANENIKHLCFSATGILVGEFDRIMNDLFTKSGNIYKKILDCLKDGARNLHDIRNHIQYGNSGTLSMYMEHLEASGFVKRYNQWSLKTTKPGKQSLYSISDPYIRFYLKYIQPRYEQIMAHKLENLEISSLPGFDAILGLQLESLLLQNRNIIIKLLDIPPGECVYDNPFLQKPNTRHKGCQIDYLIQTRNKNIYACEFKFKLKEITGEIIEEIQEKISRLSVPKKLAVVPVLFHIGGVAASVVAQDFFYRIIDLEDILHYSESSRSSKMHRKELSHT